MKLYWGEMGVISHTDIKVRHIPLMVCPSRWWHGMN